MLMYHVVVTCDCCKQSLGQNFRTMKGIPSVAKCQETLRRDGWQIGNNRWRCKECVDKELQKGNNPANLEK